METIKQTLLSGWNFMRFLRLGFGIFFIVQGIQTHDTLIGLAGAFFLFTAVTNTGCCGAGRCASPVQKDATGEPEEITFEEIENK
ncbi:MAG: hypothetical protein ABI172_10005 [Ginsengibacter sp.]